LGPARRRITAQRMSRELDDSNKSVGFPLGGPGFSTPASRTLNGGPWAGLGRSKFVQPACVVHRVPVAVIVEIGVHIPPGCPPFRDPCRPPAQIGIGVGARIEPVPVRAVQPDLHEWRRRPQHARQRRAADHAVADAVSLQEREHRVGMPAVMAKFDRDPHPGGYAAEEVLQARVVAGQAGRKLDEKHPAARTEIVPTAADPFHPALRPVQLRTVGQSARCLHRHAEAVWQTLSPRPERTISWPSVEARVQLHAAESLRVHRQPVGRPQAGRVQHPIPMRVTPARRPNPQRHDSVWRPRQAYRDSTSVGTDSIPVPGRTVPCRRR
jgi:hypothetical protein